MKSMKAILIMMGLAVSCFAAITTHASLTLDFAVATGSAIQFNGTSYSFEFTSTGYQWEITSAIGSQATGSAIGLYGSFAGGPFGYGGISSPFPGVQTASVTTPTILEIFDGTGFLTANASFTDVSTSFNGVLGIINLNSVVNLSHFSYIGTNADLMTLAQSGEGSLVMSFPFTTTETLTQLSSGSTPIATSYSGNIEAVPMPEPATMAAGALLLIPLGWGSLRMFRK